MDGVDMVQTALERGNELAGEVIRRIEAPPRPKADPCDRCLLAEGDSWFHNPWVDVLSMLEDRYGYEVASVARVGDTLERIAYEPSQLDRLTRTLERLLRRGVTPEAVLISAGGNDAVRENFSVLLEHARSPRPGINPGMVDALVNDRLKYAMVTLTAALGRVTESLLGSPLPILVHGYGYGVPDGRGFLGGFGPLPGPWLEPAFRAKGYTDPERRRVAVHALIDSFNTMLAEIPTIKGLSHVHPVDVRPLLPDHGDYRMWWANELHPTSDGFERVASAFHSKLERLRASS